MENSNLIQKFKDGVPVTKKDIAELSSTIITKLEGGELNAIELLKNFKMLEKLQESVKSAMMKAALSEAGKYPGNEFEFGGVTFKKTEVGVKYDYSQTNDLQYKSILETEGKLKEEKKKREDFLKSIQGSVTISGEFVDTDTGEVLKEITVYPPTRTSTSTLSVTIK